MSQTIKILGTTYEGVEAINAKDASTDELVKFVDTSDANAVAGEIKRDKTAYVNGQKVVGTSDAIVPEGEYNIEIRDVVGQTIENVTNYETVNIQVRDSDGGYLEAGSYYQVQDEYLQKTQWPDIPSEGYYYFYSSAYPIDYPSSEGIYNATEDGEYNYHFEQVSDGYYQINNNSIAELSIEPVYYFYDDGQETDKILLYHNSDTPRSDLVTDGKALKISYIEQNDHYEYKTITTYPQADGVYEYNIDSDSFSAALTKSTAYWITEDGDSDAINNLTENGVYVISGLGSDASAELLNFTVNQHYRYDETGIDDYPTFTSVDTYPQVDGNYTYTKSTDSFTNAPPTPSGTLSINADGYNDTFDVTNYAAVDITITTEYGSELYPDTFYVSTGSGITTPNRGVYLVFDSSGQYNSENIVDTNVDGIFAFKYEVGGSSSYLEEITDGVYNISDGEASVISSGYYEISGESISTLNPGTLITQEDSSTVLNEGLYNIYDSGGSGWKADLVSNGYYGIYDGAISSITATYVYLLGSGEYDVLDGYYFFEAANNEGTPLEIIDGETWRMAGENSYKLTNTLQAFADQGQSTSFDDMAVGSEQTVTFVTGHQYKITRLN